MQLKILSRVKGGALLVNDKKFSELAEIIREKGTNRSRYIRGEVDKYTWQHVGSSYLPSEMIAAFLFAQLEEAETITKDRLSVWNNYHANFAELEQEGLIRRPIVPDSCQHNAHIYYLLVEDVIKRKNLVEYLKQQGVHTAFHYVPLHSSPAGKKYGRIHGDLAKTDLISDSLVRLPLFADMDDAMINKVIKTTKASLLG